jgi:hypothetical protein
MVGQAPYRWEPHDHNRCSCVAQEVVLVGPSGQEFVNSSFALSLESSEVSATSLSEIDQQEARPQRCSERQHLADSWQGGRNWCSLARNCGHLVHSTLPYSSKRWGTLKWPVYSRYGQRVFRGREDQAADLTAAARSRGNSRCLRWV